MFYLNNKLVLQAVNKATAFIAIRFLKDIFIKTTQDTLYICQINVYLGPLDYFVYNTRKNFVFIEFKQNAYIISTKIKEVLVKAYNNIKKVKQYYTPLQRLYKIL